MPAVCDDDDCLLLEKVAVNTHHKLTFVLIILAAAALWQLGIAGWIHAKAIAAQILLERAWYQTLHNHQQNRPWPWADTWPVAELIIPGLDIEQIVLAGDSSATLAFGPGHSFASAMPDEHGTVMISGHRDTHFGFLQNLQKGQRIILKTRSGIHYYRVKTTNIVDSRSYKADIGNDELILVTCYPFNSTIVGGTERYLVYAQRDQTG
jgi:sortase A